MKFSRVALLGAATLAAAHNHKHVHQHPARHASPVERRSPDVVAAAAEAVATVYELNGKPIPYADVLAGVKDGIYELIGERISTVIPAPSTPSPTPTKQAAKFIEKPKPSTTPTSTYVPPATSEAPSPTPKSSASTIGGSIDEDFPSGEIDCDDFATVSKYGPVALDYLGLGGWSGLQSVPGFTFGVSSVVSFLETPLKGSVCGQSMFCSFACPAPYLRMQWPEAQGSTGQSIGGLWCNSNNKLVLTSTSSKKLCAKGIGGVSVKNKLGKGIAICQTDYPGTESETIPTWVDAGATSELACNDQSSYYHHLGSPTSLQFYVNPAGVSQEEGCQWGASGAPWVGNFAPVNIGGSRGSDGVIYISLAPNAATIDQYEAKLNFNIAITGGSGTCEYHYADGSYWENGSVKPKGIGCTVGITSGSQGVYEFTS